MEVLLNHSDLIVNEYSLYSNPILTASESEYSTCLQLILNLNKFKITLYDANINPFLVAAQNHHFEYLRLLSLRITNTETNEKKIILQYVLNNEIEFI